MSRTYTFLLDPRNTDFASLTRAPLTSRSSPPNPHLLPVSPEHPVKFLHLRLRLTSERRPSDGIIIVVIDGGRRLGRRCDTDSLWK